MRERDAAWCGSAHYARTEVSELIRAGSSSSDSQLNHEANMLFDGLRWVALLLLLWAPPGLSATLVDYPTKPIRLVVVYPPGGGIDILARSMGQQLVEAWGVPIVVDNRPGAGTTIGAATVAKAAPDGYTLLMTDVSFAITPSLYARLPYDAQKSFSPISLLNLVTDVLAVHPSLPVTSVKEFITYAKANPGKILYASAGNGTLNHLAPEMLKAMAGINLVHVGRTPQSAGYHGEKTFRPAA